MKNHIKMVSPRVRFPLGASLLLTGLLVVSACDVESEGGDTGGLGGMGGSASGEPRGFVVVNTDYESASISLVGLDGDVLSQSIISSSSVEPGLSAALSGDVVVPTTVLSGDELVLIDRAGVLTWVDFDDGDVRAQLSVSTGFSSNPQDYVPVSETKAYVTRFGANMDAGQEDFDAGNDVLVIDPSVPEITGSIDLTSVLEGEDDQILPRAEGAILAGGKLRVLAIALSGDFATSAETRLVTIDPETDAIESVVVIDDFTSCGDMSLSPDGQRLAIACNGAFGQDPEDEFPDSGIVLFDTADEPEERARFLAKDLGGEQIGGVDFATSDVVAYTTLGRYNEDRSAMAAPDTARFLNLDDGEAGEPVVENEELPFNLGGMRCIPSESVCLVADAETEGGVVHLITLDSRGAVKEKETFPTDQSTGIPPRYLGEF